MDGIAQPVFATPEKVVPPNIKAERLEARRLQLIEKNAPVSASNGDAIAPLSGSLPQPKQLF